jgi:SAM-dependent methyltransferase
MPDQPKSFENLVQEAWTRGIQGWDWSYLDGRRTVETLPWDYPALARGYIAQAKSLLEIGTGGGELFSTFRPFPPCTVALEAYPPSVGLAGRTLSPLGVKVVWTEDNIAVPLPFADATFDLVVNRHAGYSASEVFRVLRPGGRLLTQQVGGQNEFRLNELFQEQPHFVYGYWKLPYALQELETAGFSIQSQQEAHPEARYFDIGAVVYYLSVIDWQVPEFDIHIHEDKLRQIDQTIQDEGSLVTWEHYFIIEANKPL